MVAVATALTPAARGVTPGATRVELPPPQSRRAVAACPVGACRGGACGTHYQQRPPLA